MKGRRFSSLIKYNIHSEQKTTLEENRRELKLKRKLGKDWCIYITDKELNGQKISGDESGSFLEETSVFVENTKLVLFINGERKELAPFGKMNYIWPSISPDKSKLLFTCAGKGTFISDLNGKIISELGYANFPSWSPDGNWILYMTDYDDGVKVTSSDIGIFSINTKVKFELTETADEIEMYPNWGSSNQEVVYNTLSGQIRKITLKFN